MAELLDSLATAADRLELSYSETAHITRNAASTVKRLQAENERMRAALQRIADFKEQEYDGYNTATILSGIAWAALARSDR